MEHVGQELVHFHQTRRGVMAHFAADDCIGVCLHMYGEWAEDEIALLRPYVSPGDVVLDVGANVGSHTLAFAEMVGPTGRVVAIEAEPSTYALLAHNVVANGLAGRVTALPVLAGAEPALVSSSLTPLGSNAGAKSFFVDVHGTDVHGTPLAGLPPQPKGLPIRLAMITVDDLALDACAVVKIDVEGMELDVLRGAQATLHRTRPLVYFEQAAGASSGLSDIAAMLRNLGYRLYRHVARPYNPHNFKKCSHNIFGDATEINVVGVPDGAPPPEGLEEIA